MTVETPPIWQLALAVGAGGSLGAVGRFALAVALRPSDPMAMPWGTLAANLVGCLAIGLAMGWIERSSIDPVLATGLTTGFLGAFTTFATFGFETTRLLRGGQTTLALTYVAISLVAGLALVVAGQWLAGQWLAGTGAAA